MNMWILKTVRGKFIVKRCEFMPLLLSHQNIFLLILSHSKTVNFGNDDLIFFMALFKIYKINTWRFHWCSLLIINFETIKRLTILHAGYPNLPKKLPQKNNINVWAYYNKWSNDSYSQTNLRSKICKYRLEKFLWQCSFYLFEIALRKLRSCYFMNRHAVHSYLGHSIFFNISFNLWKWWIIQLFLSIIHIWIQIV